MFRIRRNGMKDERRRMVGKEVVPRRDGCAAIEAGFAGPLGSDLRPGLHKACSQLLAPATSAGLQHCPASSPSPFMTAASLSADQIQRHLYASFLHARTPDVTLRVRGSWLATYLLHRVVLIQSGFFNSLFTAGFAESSPKPEEIDIIFDDTNITRAAFELCISRLYGGGPPLHIFPSLVPSTAQPLTSAFPFTSADLQIHPPTPSGHHPGTPRFLVSLLATSVYLSIPSLAAHALASILSTMGPYTVMQYLDFALGKPIGPPDPDWNEPDAAVGLEHIAQNIPDEASSAVSIRSVDTDDAPPEKQFHYGAISDKVGEAAACWLARWAPDMLAFEERKAGIKTASEPAVLSRRRAKPEASSVSDYSAVPTIWDRDGLSVKWVCALASADTLFVRGERARYDFARSVVELRRRHGILQEEEDAWKTFSSRAFITAIWYTMEDVIDLSKDSSPTTKQPFVSIAVLQAAHWQNSIMRQHITARPASSSFETRPSPAPTPGSPVQREKELGITQTTAEIRARLAAADPSRPDRSVHPPSVDGAPVSMDELFTTSFTPSSPTSPTTPKPNAPSALARASVGEANFFGIQTRRYTARACVAADPAGTARWTLHPPFRFAAEFWDTEVLPEKARLYSHTVWYGGSLFNAYVQVSTLDIPGASASRGESQTPGALPPSASAPPGSRQRHGSLVGGDQGRGQMHTRGPSLPAIMAPPPASPHYSPSIHPPTRSTTPVSAVSSSLPSASSMVNLALHAAGYSLNAPAPPAGALPRPAPVGVGIFYDQLRQRDGREPDAVCERTGCVFGEPELGGGSRAR
ncbi:BTB domain-containing protein [Mycena venus]|uniref:BTB domain-containing protein n=1 Tax=Mycena venus TaxID=2733690 RepID=A0A8H6XGM4_9AGAR|nr:BTB domain-containing protein [Mycena venus]